MFSEEDLPAILRRFKIVTSAELGPPPPRQEDAVGDEGRDPPQQVCLKYFVVGHNFNHLIKEAAEQEQAQQGVGEVPPVDEPQVDKFASCRYFYPLFSAGRRRRRC